MRNNKRIIAIIVISFTILLAFLLNIRGTEADQTVYNVDISTSPANGFLIADNLAPGDKKTSVLKISNNGNLDFNYSVSSRQESGDLNLYSQIQLMIYDGQGKLYEGPLNGLSQFALGTIAKTDNRDLTFTAQLPLNVGNDAQGKTISVAFDFTAIGHEEEIPTDGCFEPPFSNRNYTMQQKSTTPIKFHLRDSEGNLDITQHQNVKLTISGSGIKTTSESYIFSPTDGTLKFPKNIDEPHYQARFSTWDYPVVSGNTYSANVYVGEKLVCKKDFMVLDNGNRSNAP